MAIQRSEGGDYLKKLSYDPFAFCYLHHLHILLPPPECTDTSTGFWERCGKCGKSDSKAWRDGERNQCY